jgi:crotonobetainyl-CoA:carnitine CoA-transferase CaiB-like acyl-CoA transferase
MGPKLVKEAEELYRTKTTAEWGKLFEEAGVPSGPVYFVEELFDHPQALENGLVTEMDHELLGHLRMVGPAFQMSESPLEPRGASPVLGADNDEILQAAGLRVETIAKLREAGSLR